MLYDVFLHELGHIQVVDKKAKTIRRRFASETRAQEFAEHWCRELWSRPFDHPDPVHSPPSPEEIETLSDGWLAANSDYKKGLLCEKAKRYEEAIRLLTRAVERYPGHSMALERLGVLTYSGMGTTQSTASSIVLLGTAVRLDPTLFDANLFLGLALAREDREAEARRCFERAILLDSHPPIALSMYADSMADWGYFAEAEALFQKAIKRDKECALAIRDYGRTLLRDHNPEAENNLGRAIGLFERAVAVDPGDAESHYRLGDALRNVDGEMGRAIGHLERALKINAAHAKAAEVLAEIQAARDGADEN
jgi:tetratricopeptide (TPR) repeat protein